MRRSLLPRFAVVLVLLFCIGIAGADVPRKIHYQALIKNPSGDLIDGLADLKIQIFNAPVGGESLWAENPILEVQAGRLDLTLPVLDPAGFPDFQFEALLASDELWLELLARPDGAGQYIEFPRQQILTSGFALRTATVDGARGGNIEGDLNLAGQLNLPDGIEIRSSGGNLVIDASTSSITLAADGTVTISSSRVEIISSGDLDLQGQNVNITASQSCTVEGQSGLDLRSGAITAVTGSLVTLN